MATSLKEMLALRKQPFVSIIRTEPQIPIEGQRLTVYFQFFNQSDSVLNGWIGGDMNSGTARPGKSFIDWPVKDLAAGAMIQGAVMVQATDAGPRKQLRIFFYDTQTPVNDAILKSDPKFEIAEQQTDVAATINFVLESFTINHTRSPKEDTDFAALYAEVDEQPVGDPQGIFMGNFSDGTYPFTAEPREGTVAGHLQTGPFAMVPGGNSTLRISYAIYNGGGGLNKEEFLKGFGEAVKNPELFKGRRQGDIKWIQFLKVLNPFLNLIGACDGLVAVHDDVISADQLFAENSSVLGNREDIFDSEDYASPIGCGNTSKYSVRSSINRVSHYINNGGKGIGLLFVGVRQGTTVDLNEPFSAIMPNYALWKTIEVIDENGNFSESNNIDTGFLDEHNHYHAPVEINDSKLIIIRGVVTGPQAMMERMMRHDENAPFGKATAIVQLIPGALTMNAPIEPGVTETPGATPLQDGSQQEPVQMEKHDFPQEEPVQMQKHDFPQEEPVQMQKHDFPPEPSPEPQQQAPIEAAKPAPEPTTQTTPTMKRHRF